MPQSVGKKTLFAHGAQGFTTRVSQLDVLCNTQLIMLTHTGRQMLSLCSSFTRVPKKGKPPTSDTNGLNEKFCALDLDLSNETNRTKLSTSSIEGGVAISTNCGQTNRATDERYIVGFGVLR